MSKSLDSAIEYIAGKAVGDKFKVMSGVDEKVKKGYYITDDIHGTAEIILKSDLDGFTIYGFSGDDLMQKNALYNIDIWKEQITEILKTKRSELRLGIRNDIIEYGDDPKPFDKILEFVEEHYKEVYEELFEMKPEKLMSWMKKQEDIQYVHPNKFQARDDVLEKDVEELKKKGAIFSSHIDGKKIILSPEKSIQIQKIINSDIFMVLDECPKLTNDKKIIAKAIDISTDWAKRSKKEFNNADKKALFGIVQGGLFEDLRIESLEKLLEINFDGYALGGLAVGEKQDEMFKILENITKKMPENKPRYLMGVGTPSDILGAVKFGIDMFDCVMPTRSGRTGLAFTWEGKINLRNSKFKNDKSPLDKSTQLKNLNKYSKSYLNHLINTNEILASMIISLHNINFYQEFMNQIRQSILNGTFDNFYKENIGKYK